MTPILDMIYKLKYDETPDYDKIMFAFSKAIMDLNMPPSINNYDWVRSGSNLIQRVPRNFQ